MLVLLALGLREPIRGRYERAAAGADDAVAAVEDPPESAWATMRTLGRIPSVRRIWIAAPFLGVAFFGVPSLLSLIYEEVFGLGSAHRGAIAAGVEPLQIVGVLLVMPTVAPFAVASGAILASAGRFVRNDIDGIRSDSVARPPTAVVHASRHGPEPPRLVLPRRERAR